MVSAKPAATFYTTNNPADAHVQLRAAQAALFRGGLLLHHEPRRADPPGYEPADGQEQGTKDS